MAHICLAGLQDDTAALLLGDVWCRNARGNNDLGNDAPIRPAPNLNITQ